MIEEYFARLQGKFPCLKNVKLVLVKPVLVYNWECVNDKQAASYSFTRKIITLPKTNQIALVNIISLLHEVRHVLQDFEGWPFKYYHSNKNVNMWMERDAVFWSIRNINLFPEISMTEECIEYIRKYLLAYQDITGKVNLEEFMRGKFACTNSKLVIG